MLRPGRVKEVLKERLRVQFVVQEVQVLPQPLQLRLKRTLRSAMTASHGGLFSQAFFVAKFPNLGREQLCGFTDIRAYN